MCCNRPTPLALSNLAVDVGDNNFAPRLLHLIVMIKIVENDSCILEQLLVTYFHQKIIYSLMLF